MTVKRETIMEEHVLNPNLSETLANLEKVGVSFSSEGDQETEVKHVTWQKQKEPKQEVDHIKSRLRVVPPKWETSKADETLGIDLELIGGEKLEDGQEVRVKTNVPIRITRSPTSNFVGPMSPRSPGRLAGENAILVERNRFLEAALKKSTLECEEMKRDFEEDKNDLLDKIECLEIANEQLLAGGENSGTEQLQMELARVQKHNTVLAQRERELQFQLSTKDMLQKEVQHLQELNEQLLDTRLPAETETENSGKMLERIVTLETELAEAMEVNNLYKSQLHTAFSAQQNVQGKAPDVALEDEISKLREQNKTLETEIQELRDRYFLMSIRLAEREAQHEEAMMKMRKHQNPLKHSGGSFKW